MASRDRCQAIGPVLVAEEWSPCHRGRGLSREPRAAVGTVTSATLDERRRAIWTSAAARSCPRARSVPDNIAGDARQGKVSTASGQRGISWQWPSRSTCSGGRLHDVGAGHLLSLCGLSYRNSRRRGRPPLRGGLAELHRSGIGLQATDQRPRTERPASRERPTLLPPKQETDDPCPRRTSRLPEAGVVVPALRGLG